MKTGKKRKEVYKDVPVINTLREIMEGNTQYYKTDFDYDIQMIRELYGEQDEKNKILLWMSRDCGTWCFRLRDVILSPTSQRSTWMYYKEGFHTIRAYMVFLKEEKGGDIYGDVYGLDYQAYCRHLESSIVPVGGFRLIFENGELYKPSLEKLFMPCYGIYGKLLNVIAQPEDPLVLNDTIRKEESVFHI